MTADSDSRLDAYGAAFDYYLEHRTLPPDMPADDRLAAYMREVIDGNPPVDAQWLEVLKEDMITFFAAILEQQDALQREAERERELMRRFREASLEEKRQMWSKVTTMIQRSYSKYEVNLEGYTEQFKTDDREAIFAALTGDWEAACAARLERRQSQVLQSNKAGFEAICRDVIAAECEERRRVAAMVYKYPQLRELVDVIGRDKDLANNERDSVVYKFLPVTVAKNPAVEEVDRVEMGNNLARVLPVELAMPDDLFFKRFATKELQQFSSPGRDKPRRTEEHRRDPRLTKGPIIVSIDTSGSMCGRPLQIAYALLRQLLTMAKRQKRPCFLITFSVSARSIDLSKPRNWGKLDDFLDERFTGGTSGEEMLRQAIATLHTDAFEMADVLIISDLEFAEPSHATANDIDREKALGTRFYALQIGSNGNPAYARILTRIFTI